MRLRGWRVITRKTNGETTTENWTTCRKETGEKVRVENEGVLMGEERSTCDRRKGEGKKVCESRCVETGVNNRDDDRKKGGRKERNNKESGGENSTSR